MATTYKVLGQSAPSATTNTDVYTVPADTQAIISTIFVSNRGTSANTYRIAVRPAAETLADKHYVIYDVTVNPKTTDAFTNGITLSATDVITVYASSADFSFNVFGSEIS
jgi:hypothetical protein